MPHRAVLVAAALSALACGRAGPEPDAGPPRDEVREPGQGSGALLVEARVTGEATGGDRLGPGRFRTSTSVSVRRGDAPVGDALVRVNDRTLAHRGGGVYSDAPRPGLPPEVVLVSVRAGSDWLNGAVSSPGARGERRVGLRGGAPGSSLAVTVRGPAPAAARR